jgi:hypothetical protein
MLALQQRKASRASVAVFVTLVIAIVCVAMVIILAPRPIDALSELKSLPLYPNARLSSFSGNTQYEQSGGQWWALKEAGGMGSYSPRRLNVSLATVTFETNDGPEAVLKFYDEQMTQRGYYEVSDGSALQEHLKWTHRFGALGEMVESTVGDDLINQPRNFHNLRITATSAPSQQDARSDVTLISVEYRALMETGGLLFYK